MATQWFATGTPPWHLWGNTQPLSVLPLGGGAVPPVATGQQMCKVEYGRPESWNWLFSAKLISGPPTLVPGDHVTLVVHWDLIVGIGRATILIPDFDVFTFNWNDGDVFPVNRQIWSSSTLSPAKSFVAGPPAAAVAPVTQIAGQDIQLGVRCFATELGITTAPIVVELSAHFAPVNHIRPDWYLEQPDNVAFAGSEQGAH